MENGKNETRAPDKTFGRCMSLAKPYVPSLVAVVVVSLAGAGVMAAFPWVIRDLVDKVLVAGSDASMLLLLGILGGLVVGRHALVFTHTAIASRVQINLTRRLQSELFRKILGRPYPFFTMRPTGDLMATITSDVFSVVTVVFIVVGEIIRHPVTIAALAGTLIVMDWRLAVFGAGMLPLVVVPVYFVRRYVRRNSVRLFAERGMMFQSVAESLEGIKTVKSYGLEARASDRFDGSASAYHGKVFKNLLAQALLSPLPEILGFLGFAAGLYFLRGELAADAVTTGEIAALMGVIIAMYGPVASLSSAWVRIESQLPAARRVMRYLDLDAPKDEDGRNFDGPIEEIKLENVTFAYEPGKPVLGGFSLHAKRGEFIAVRGPSGSGKTTIADIILRLVKPQQGKVLINNEDASLFKDSALRRHMGIVTQDARLFDDTLSGNILLGEPEAGAEKVRAAAERARVTDFADKLPTGLDTPAGGRGVLVSGGEAQRVALARALVRDASVLVFDEATSALDDENELQILETVRELAKERIVIFFSHKQSVTAAADRTVDLSDNKD